MSQDARPYDLVILDFDGVLADSAGWVTRNFNAIARRHGFRAVSEAELAALRGRPNREVVAELGVPFWRLPAIARDVRARMAAEAHTIPLFEGAADFLQALQARAVATAIVSSNAEATIRRMLGPAAAAVSHYACGAAIFGKARVFRTVVRRSRISAGRVICIGDEERDIEAARRAGLACAAATWGYATPAVLQAARPDHLLDDFDAALRLVLGRQPS